MYTVAEAAEELKTSARRIRQMCAAGQLDAIKNGKSWLIQLGRPPRNDRAVSGRDVMRSKGRSV